jgi:hypothetical protein
MQCQLPLAFDGCIVPASVFRRFVRNTLDFNVAAVKAVVFDRHAGVHVRIFASSYTEGFIAVVFDLRFGEVMNVIMIDLMVSRLIREKGTQPGDNHRTLVGLSTNAATV